MFKPRSRALIAAAFFASFCLASAHAQAPLTAAAPPPATFPTQTVRIIAPFSPGSGPDTAMRIVADELAKQWKQAVIIDNRTGASGIIAATAAKAAAPTGHELLLADVGHMSVNPSMFKNLSYDPKADFLPVSTIFTTAFFVAVSSQSKIQSMKELIAQAAANPDKVSYGSFAVGSIGHLGGAQLEAATGTKMVHVAFKEASQLYTSIAAADVTWGLASIGSAGALYKADKLRFIAVADSVRSPILPAVPTIRESGGPDGINGKTWVALFAPKGTPTAVTERIQRSVAAILRQPEVMEKFRAAGLLASSSTQAELATLVERDAGYYGALVKRTGASAN
ncbi:MAG: tripartite tricarboxylate transporter substrate binding protein [Polaromonas sp.]|uniref:Bug family tripartite tricarboxylate transporter substrate binding protein n=1 Tax=Polaromonas sp. TaxID=1869339 RepID=UPI0025E71A5A|nr:tripartite tricarboxylate transporter substrate binding protein [Polaromonas sp.]MBI2725364.1 tripartite tricarboxylate transporter substrate binding protein [Polaromonas sp.]